MQWHSDGCEEKCLRLCAGRAPAWADASACTARQWPPASSCCKWDRDRGEHKRQSPSTRASLRAATRQCSNTDKTHLRNVRRRLASGQPAASSSSSPSTTSSSTSSALFRSMADAPSPRPSTCEGQRHAPSSGRYRLAGSLGFTWGAGGWGLGRPAPLA